MPRILWMILGFAALLSGVAGIILPLLPTTPFLLLAAFAFGRSSQRLHDWLVGHPRLGPPVHDWTMQGAISRNAKIAAVAAMIVAFLASLTVGVHTGVLAVQSLVLAAAATFVVTRPRPTNDEPE